MSSQIMFVCVAAAALLAAGCGKETASAAPAAAAAPAAPADSTGPRVLELTANDTMKFGVPGREIKPGEIIRFEVKAGESLRLVLRNTGNLPKEAMGHNVVVLKSGVNVEEFAAAAITAGAAKGFFPAERAEQTLAHTPLVGPKGKVETSFTAPAEPGEYVFLCTFPGHFATGMRGLLVVQ